MDLHVIGPLASPAERAAVDAVLGPPESGWVGGPRDSGTDGHAARGGHAIRARRSQLLPALHAVQSRIGWISTPGAQLRLQATGRRPGRGLRRRDVLRPVRHDPASAARGPRLRRHRLPAGRRGGTLRGPDAGRRAGRGADPGRPRDVAAQSVPRAVRPRARGDGHDRRRGAVDVHARPGRCRRRAGAPRDRRRVDVP